jgi:hypothetical protein
MRMCDAWNWAIARVAIFLAADRILDCFVASLLAMTVDGSMVMIFGICDA